MFRLHPPGAAGRSVLPALLLAALPLSAQLTDSPHTVAPGRALLEIDGLSLSFDRRDGEGNRYDAVGVASTFLTAGLTSTFDLGVGIDLFLREKLEDRGGRDSSSGIGGVTVRPRWTFWRNDQAGALAAIMPYVKFPTGSHKVSNQAVEGGIILPWEMATPGGFKAGAMLRWDVVRNDDDNGYDGHGHFTGFMSRQLTKRLAVYGEATGLLSSTGFSDSAATLGGGVLWRFLPHLEFDYELQRGLNRRASAWTHVWRVNWEW